MEIQIYNKETGEKIGELRVRKNTTHKTIIENIKIFLAQKYNCIIRRLLPTGKIDFQTGAQDISYVIFGENLPFKQIYFIKK